MKKKIAVIFGGRSVEHDVSIITAHTPIIDALIATKEFEVWPVYIAKDGSWYSNQLMNDISYFKKNLEDRLKKEKKIQISFDDGLKIIWPGIIPKSIKIDIAFPAMHGTFGEDGSLMGLLRMADIPFVGCDLSASAVAMDKVITKQVAESEAIPVVPYVWFTKNDWKKNKNILKKDISNLNWPLFVKPAHLGSSIAITKVEQEDRLEDAIEVALHYDDKVLVEESVKNLIEVTLPIMGNENLELGAIERAMNKSDFFDFQEKYLSNNKKTEGVNTQYSEIPAKIDKELTERVKYLGKATYLALGCSGISRIDMLIDGANREVYVNEVNTLPGSLYHHNWKKIGVSGIELVKKLITLAEERHKKSREITHTFDSDVLNSAGGKKPIN